jgi:molecular chaperone DnaJ
MWDIGEKENKGMWKTTIILFGSLAVVTLFILVFSK